jgi:hypothetical protein
VFARDCSSHASQVSAQKAGANLGHLASDSQVSAQRTGANLGHLPDLATLAEAMH